MPRGRKPTPTALLRLRGSSKADRPDEPTPPPGIPAPPDHLNALALAEWKRITPHLAALGLLTDCDLSSLASYCATYARWCEAEADLRIRGLTIKTKRGHEIQNPMLAIANKAVELAAKFATELGLSPAARARLHVKPPAKPNPSARFFPSPGGSPLMRIAGAK